jgi:hypothetical protein
MAPAVFSNQLTDIGVQKGVVNGITTPIFISIGRRFTYLI